MFGQTGNSSFGFNSNAQNSPFGQSTFGKTITTTFGTSAPPVFGSNAPLFSSKPAGSTTGSLFGNTTNTSTFGANTVTQSSFGGFGSTSNNTPLFGSQQNVNANLFGTSNAPSTFGQANKSSFGFGQSSGTNLFGQSQQTSQQTTFGQSPAPGNSALFGTNSGFGGSNSVNTLTGTVVKFNPVTSTDTMLKNGVTQTISTRHHCITCMKEYESKSLEELRLEDYTAGRKGISQGQTPVIFGTTSQSSPFGNIVSNSSNVNSGFGPITNGFGNTSQPNNSNLFSKPMTGFGTPATTSGAFAFNSTTASNLFNAQSKPFGVTSTTPLFASSTTTTPGSAFGSINTQNAGFGTGFNSNQSNQSIGLFNQNKSTFNMPSTSTTNFGFGQSTTTNNNSLFASKPIGSNFGTAFGGIVNSSFQTGNTGFASAQNTNSTLFNNSFKSSGQSSGFNFGNPSSAVTGSSNSSLFNSSAKPNLFSNTNTATTFNPTGTFGSIPTFGSNNNTASTLSSNLFGPGICLSNVPNNSGSVPVHQQILALVSAPFGDSPLLKNLLPACGKSEQFLKPSNTMSKINSPNYRVITGNSTTKIKPKVATAIPLSKKSLFDGLEEECPLLEAFQPRPNAKRLVLRPRINNLNESNTKINKFIQKSMEVTSQITDKENEIQNNKVSNEHRRSTNSWLKSSLSKKNTDEQYLNQSCTFPFVSELPIVEELENTITEFMPPMISENQTIISNNEFNNETEKLNQSIKKTNEDLNLCENKSLYEPAETSASIQLSGDITSTAEIKLQRHGYYTIPPVDMLSNFVKDKTCIVPHFTIGRKGYGNVFFPESFDIYGLNFDEIVHFRHKEVIIYPDDSTKPPIGQGLNRKAQITLDRVWPHDKSNHEPITDPKRLIDMDYEGKLRRVSAKHDTKFLEYRPETGSWVFKVDHFSKYGLSDSDDDDNEKNTNAGLKSDKNFYVQSLKKGSRKENNSVDKYNIELNNSELKETNISFYNVSCQTNYSSSKQSAYSPTSLHARFGGTKAHTLQLMKASFFEMTDNNSDSNYSQHAKAFINNCKCDLQNIFIQEKQFLNRTDYMKEPTTKPKKALIMPIVRPRITNLKIKSWILPYNHSVTNKLKFVNDIGLQIRKIFKPKWSPELSLLSISTQQHSSNIGFNNAVEQLGMLTANSENDIMTTTNVQRLQLLGATNIENDCFNLFKSTIEGHLNIQLQYSEIVECQDCPIIKTKTGESSKNALQAHKIQSLKLVQTLKEDKLTRYSCNIWKLCESLWGITSNPRINQNITSHEIMMFRKEALSEWLKDLITGFVQQEMVKVETNDQIILLLLTANKLEEACKRALNVGDHCLALLLSQIGGTNKTLKLIQQQIKLWQETDADSNLSIQRLKLFMLMAGVPFIYKKNEIVHICQNFNWKQAFAVHLWYLSPPSASIADILELYESSFLTCSMKDSLAFPTPEYFEAEFQAESSNDKPVYDLCYQLLKLYCTGNYPLEIILNPLTYTYDPLDYRLSWFLQQLLVSLGYTHLSEYASELTHTNFAAQLETFKLWHWSIFVVLHFKNPEKRRKAVLDLLLRHVQLDKSSDYIEQENFLKMKLKVPSDWINQAKAIKCCTMKRYGEAAWYYIHAQQWNKAHEIIMEHIVTDAIVNEDYDYLKFLLDLMKKNESCNLISEWSHQGQLILDYIIVTTELNSLLHIENFSNIGEKIELLKPQLISLCTKITIFPCPSIKHRLCQAEMAKRTLQLAKSLLVLQAQKDNSYNFLLNLISQLPLPEDYAQQELRPIINICVNDII